jgi:acyl-homoserine-lactone acylase
MNRILRFALFASICIPSGLVRAEKVTIYRDIWGVPHIYAKTDTAVAFGLGYAQAEDRLAQIFRNYRAAEGTVSEVFGERFFDHDYRQRAWKHAAISKEKYATLSPEARGLIEAYQAGIKHYMKTHPRKAPRWAVELEPWQVVAVTRLVVWPWPEGEAADDLKKGGIKPDPVEGRSSNEWSVSPKRSACGAAILCADPHVTYEGPTRFYEVRLHGDKIHGCGISVVGTPALAMGHNERLGWAMTTGGPDTADVYEETIDPANPKRYRYDGEWRDMTVEKALIRVRGKDGKVREVTKEICYTVHGPVVAHKGDKAYTMKLAYFDQVAMADQFYKMDTARNLVEFKAALDMRQLMAQNIMYADVDEHTYYQRTGRVPIRPAGFDWTRPVPGDTSKSEWLGIHPTKDLVQCEDPQQGYMQCCNIAPANMMKNSPMQPNRYPSYIYNVSWDDTNQRGQRSVEVLDADASVTIDEAKALFMDTTCFGFQKWQSLLKDAAAKHAGELAGQDEAKKAMQYILDWNGRADADSVGANLYKFWRMAVNKRTGGKAATDFIDKGKGDRPKDLDLNSVKALADAVKYLKDRFGTFEMPYGKIHVIAREKLFAPAGGGGEDAYGMETLRAEWFSDQPDERGLCPARGGQSAPELMIFTKPIQSWTVAPWGQSDYIDSPHFFDSAEKLVSKAQMKPTWFQKEELLKHVESKTELNAPK